MQRVEDSSNINEGQRPRPVTSSTSSSGERSPMRKKRTPSDKKTLTWEDERGNTVVDDDVFVTSRNNLKLGEVTMTFETDQVEEDVTKRKNPTFVLSIAEEDLLKEKIAEFKRDPQLMEVATRFVNEVIELAKEEAAKRIKEKKLEYLEYSQSGGAFGKTTPWHRRAQGIMARVLNCLCLCPMNPGKS